MRLAFAPLIYSTKLKVEFLILNCLTGMTQQRAELRNISIPIGNQTDEATLNEAEMAATKVLLKAPALERAAGRDFGAYGIHATDWDDLDVEAISAEGSQAVRKNEHMTTVVPSLMTTHCPLASGEVFITSGDKMAG